VIEQAAKLGVADTVELHTGAYCDADDEDLRRSQLLALKIAAKRAEEVGFRVAAGHGLHYGNVAAVAALPGIEELNIGHSIIARAVLVGLDAAVREMLARLRAPKP
jgi:pyridoxine 5-phosphate synthase